jgi:hypothetical protein
MISEPECYRRHCKFYIGISQPDGTELSEDNVCLAFPDGIPNEIAYGNNPHSTPLPNQGNNIIFEHGKFSWETE